ncbi:NAD(P)/FAD-dependent oxidoreductase [Halieaceae bacterium IMCC14734]|uniref:NAD(P)/FAD-dependent oxidoreductase n=1 Tax=Candidatus Litorirhabdus singularis TaxID=2518993 RepID=A0ABT3TDM1_9GAMM|nr:NAD(P)/FAD-dependent oxidoreductase [Candidatus Litorirhabdus singularis]MCX2980397.1 NAD(P)/FAD-dependent oxidoreductase [Candidatus Litorirhabdus singularis]
MTTQHYDVIIVGAGLSGIGAAWHLQNQCPDKSYAILEGRATMGGTWDLFRYPGIRSDSDMHTLGYNFKPWLNAKAIADGPSIRDYIRETAAENRIEQRIHYNRKVSGAHWDSPSARWLLQTQHSDGNSEEEYSCNFLMMCAGYYSYEGGYKPDIPGRDTFAGDWIYPQEWPEALDYSGKKVVIIGSGATAVTLLPAMAEQASHVTMLQRTPTYMASKPAVDKLANLLRKILPEKWAYALTRFKNTSMQQILYHRTRTKPEQVKKLILDRVREQMGPDYDIDTHFTPDYNPWDQRLCLVPDNDLFTTVKSGKADVVTDHIEQITAQGIQLRSGEFLPADIIVCATGLNMVVMGELELSVDGEPVDLAKTWSYKGLMTTAVPNLVSTFGYINASWTLRADLTAEWCCRLLNHMSSIGAQQVVPTLRDGEESMSARPWIDDFSAGYMQREMHRFPRQGDHEPWVNPQDYGKDKKMFRTGPLEDGALVFSSPAERNTKAA